MFANTTPGTLPLGTDTEFGVIEATSLTAYQIGGRWVPFHKVHGAYRPERPLVVLG